MIVLTIAGESSRFLKAGYKEVKYKLELFNSKPVLWHILSYMDRREKLILVSNKTFKDSIWLRGLLSDLGFLSYDIVEVGSTDGQLTSAVLGIEKSKFNKEGFLAEPLIIIPFSPGWDFSNILLIKLFHKIDDFETKLFLEIFNDLFGT